MATSPVNPPALPQGYQLDQPNVPSGYTLDPETSVPGALGRGAIDAIPFGTKATAGLEAATGSGKYDDYLKELDTLLSSDKSQHPIAHYTGEAAGTVAPLLIPGVGEALGAESIAGRAGVGAGLGALQGASNTRADLTSPEGMGDVAKSAALGGIAGPVAGALGDAISGGASKAAGSLEDVANSKAVQAANLRPGTLGLPEDELQELGKQMRDWDLVKGATNKRLQKATLLKTVIGSKIGDIGAGALPLEDASPFIDKLSQEAQQSSKFFGTEGNQDLNTFRQGIANIQNNGKDFESLQALKSAYGDKAFDANGQVSNPAAAKVYGQIKDAMSSIIDGSPKEYQDVMDKYGTILDIQSGLKKQLQAEQARGVQAKGMGLAGKMGGMLLGGNPTATLGAAAALAPVHPFMAAGVASTMVTNPQVMSGVAESGANAMTKLAGSMGNVAPAAANAVTNQQPVKNIPPQYNHVFQQATQGIQNLADRNKAMTVTDFLLQSRDPNYVAAKQKQEENSGGGF